MGKVKVQKTLPSKRTIIRAPRSTWIYYLQHIREQNLDVNKNLSFGGLCQKMSPIWKKMGPEEKKPHTLSYIKDKQRYQQDFLNLTDEDRKVLRTHRRIRRKNRIGRPKAAMSTYMLFVKDERPNVVAQNPNISFQEIGRELGRRWKCVDPSTLAAYREKSKLDRVRFVQELAIWNKK